MGPSKNSCSSDYASAMLACNRLPKSTKFPETISLTTFAGTGEIQGPEQKVEIKLAED